VGAVALAGVMTLAAAPAVPAASPVRSFAPSTCHHTVFAHTSGTQYGFTSCTSSHRISLIIGNGSSWRTVKLSIHGTPLGATDNGKLTYLVYANKGSVSIAWVGRGARGAGGYRLASARGEIYSGGVTATRSHWTALFSESLTGELYECRPGCYSASQDRAILMSVGMVNGRTVVAWVTDGQLNVGSQGPAYLAHKHLSDDEVGQPRVLEYRSRAAVAFPDYTTGTVRLAVSQGRKWTFRTLGSLGTNNTSLVSVGWASNGAVVAWQTPNGLRVARYVHGSWHTSRLSGTANKALANSGTAVMRSDGSVLLLGSHTSRVVG